jgi:hypothetical protein
MSCFTSAVRSTIVCWILAAGVSAPAAAAQTRCPAGWFDASAQIVRILPLGATASRRAVDGSASPVSVDDIVCGGETISVLSPVESLEYSVGNKVVRLGPGESATIPRGAGAASTKAVQFFEATMAVAGVLRAPPARPIGTSSRGREVANGPAPLQPIHPLDDLPRQRLAPDVAAIVAWHDGVAPYTCELVDDDAEVIWRGSPSSDGRCSYRPELARAKRLRVRDARQRTVGWNIDVVAWASVPRPDWIAPGATAAIAPADLAAWGLWLWKSAPSEWRLQSLAMLDGASGREWIAAYVRDTVLAEVPVVLPQ